MIDWHKPTRGRMSVGHYLSVGSSKSAKHIGVQIVLRFNQEACKDLRLLEGDRIIIGFDTNTKEICFKRVTDSSGYKLSGKSAKTLTVTATISGLPTFNAVAINKESVKQEGTHVAIHAPTIFALMKAA